MADPISNERPPTIHEKDGLPDSRLREIQRLELAATIAAGHVHELNNVLTAVIANLSMAQLTGVEGTETAGYVAESMAAAHRAAEVVTRLQNLARPQPIAHSRIAMRDLVAQAAVLVRPLVPGNVHFDVESRDDGYIEGDPALLQQAVLNLFLNARDAVPEGGDILLSAAPSTSGTNGVQHVLRVRDTGAGIQPEVLRHIFEPFFTTKVDGAGSGLGLFAVAEIAEAHHGEVRVQSKPGAGTTVSVILPAAPTTP
jgi:two-component system, cell cycle sensor histidine kinase and response regulator CckA